MCLYFIANACHRQRVHAGLGAAGGGCGIDGRIERDLSEIVVLAQPGHDHDDRTENERCAGDPEPGQPHHRPFDPERSPEGVLEGVLLRAASVSLPAAGPGENGKDEPENAAAKHPDDHCTELAIGRANIRPEQHGNVHVVAEGAAVRAGVSCHRFTLDDGWLHGQGTEVHRKGTDANREAEM